MLTLQRSFLSTPWGTSPTMTPYLSDEAKDSVGQPGSTLWDRVSFFYRVSSPKRDKDKDYESVLGHLFQMTFKLSEGNVDGTGNGFFFKVGRRTNVDDHHRAPAIELLLKFVGWFRLGPDSPFRLRIHRIPGLLLGEREH